MASIDFTDTTGAASLDNAKPVPADRFAAWTPDAKRVGDSEVGPSTGITHSFPLRTDYLVSLMVQHLEADTLAVAMRLKLHLEDGGTCTVVTGDSASRSYTCRLAPGSEPSIEYTDRERLRYAFNVELKNTADAPLLCTY